jgi:hypothetical protein
MIPSIPIDQTPWKEAFPVKEFIYFVELFRRRNIDGNNNTKSKE